MPHKQLIVIGDGPDMDKLKKLASPNVLLLGYQPFDVLKDYMKRAKAFVFAAEEDFGIVPLEAQACGTPVIAYGKGGALETVKVGKTGLFFKEQTEAALIAAITSFEQKVEDWDAIGIRKHAETFDTSRFKSKFNSYVDQHFEDFYGSTVSIVKELKP